MKYALFSFLAVFITIIGFAQKHDPISWSTTYEKLNDSTFKIILIATIEQGWHIYSQKQPPKAISVPTTINFDNSPLIKLSGNLKEKGKMEVYKDEVSGIIQNQYENKLEFNQVVVLKKNIKTNLSGNIK